MHNNREIIPDYVIRDDARNECSRSSQEVLNLFLKNIEEAFKNYNYRTNQAIQTKSEKFVWEAVLVLEDEHTLIDIFNLCNKFKEKYGWRMLQAAVHKDEGEKCEITGENKYNYHAHIIFLMIDENGIYRFKKRDFGRKEMSKIQTFVARTLNMKRGKSKLETKRESLDHKQYRQAQETINEVKHNLMLSQNEAANFEELMLHEYAENLKKEKIIAAQNKKIEEIKKDKAEQKEEERDDKMNNGTNENTENKDDEIAMLLKKIEKLENEKRELVLQQEFLYQGVKL